jgi:hypothetical protein
MANPARSFTIRSVAAHVSGSARNDSELPAHSFAGRGRYILAPVSPVSPAAVSESMLAARGTDQRRWFMVQDHREDRMRICLLRQRDNAL